MLHNTEELIAKVNSHWDMLGEELTTYRLLETHRGVFTKYGIDNEERGSLLIKSMSQVLAAETARYITAIGLVKAENNDYKSFLRRTELALNNRARDADNIKIIANGEIQKIKKLKLEAKMLLNEAMEENYDLGMEKTLIEGTSSYLSFVITRNPAEVDTPSSGTNDDPSPLQRYKDSVELLNDQIARLGASSYAAGTLASKIKEFEIEDFAVTPTGDEMTDEEIDALIPARGDFDFKLEGHEDEIDAQIKKITDVILDTVDALHRVFAIDERAREVAVMELLQPTRDATMKMKAEMIAAIRALHTDGQDIEVMEEQIRSKGREVQSGIKKTISEIGALNAQGQETQGSIGTILSEASNFVFAALRARLNVSADYAGAVVTAVPEKGQAVIDDLKDALDSVEEAIDGR